MNRFITFGAACLCAGALVHGCSSGNPPGGADVDRDASTGDVAQADVVQPDVLEGDAAHEAGNDGGGDSGGSTCPTPVDLSSWKPPSYVPAKTSPGACAAADVPGFDTACLNAQSASTSACSAFRSAHAACASCLESKSTDGTWGPLVTWGPSQGDVNFGGCLQLLVPSDPACALADESWEYCVHAACDPVCPVTSQASYTLWLQCRTLANAGGCSTYLAQSDCIVDAATGTVCEPGQATFEQLFLAIAPVFCGGGDGG